MTTSDHDRPIDDSPLLQRQRSRRLFWKIIAGMVAVVVLLIAGIYIKAFWNSPEPKVDYLAQLNAPILAIPEEDRAWPIYREAIIRFKVRDMAMYPGEGKEYVPPYVPTDDGMTLEEIWGSGPTTKSSPAPATTPEPRPAQSPVSEPNDEKLEEHYTGSPVRIKPDEKRWPQAAAAMDAHADLYEALRQAGRKPALGLPLANVHTGEDAVVFPPPQPGDLWYEISQDDSLRHVRLHFLGLSRTLARIIALDVHYAAHQKDWPRVVANMQAISDLARHLRQPRLPLHEMVGASLSSLWIHTFKDLYLEHGNAMPDQTLADLADILRSWPTWDPGHDLDEIYYDKDEMQRLFGPNGQLTYAGLVRLQGANIKIYQHPMLKKLGFDEDKHSHLAKGILLPLLVATTASHDETLRQYQHLQRLYQLDARIPLWESLHSPGHLRKQFNAWESDSNFQNKYWLVIQMTRWQSIISTYLQSAAAWREAYITLIALERHHRRHGHYPVSLQELVPTYLAEQPVDHSTGKPLLYRIVDNKPLLYGRGMDGDDDGGKQSTYGDSGTPARDEDWVFFPIESRD